MPRRFPNILGKGNPQGRFNEAAASNAAEIMPSSMAWWSAACCFNEAAASNAAEIVERGRKKGARRSASMRPRQVMPRR